MTVVPACFWCDTVVEFSDALIHPNGRIQCRDCRDLDIMREFTESVSRDLDIMREFTESVSGAVKKLRTDLLAARIKDNSADMNRVIGLHGEKERKNT